MVRELAAYSTGSLLVQAQKRAHLQPEWHLRPALAHLQLGRSRHSLPSSLQAQQHTVRSVLQISTKMWRRQRDAAAAAERELHSMNIRTCRHSIA